MACDLPGQLGAFAAGPCPAPCPPSLSSRLRLGAGAGARAHGGAESLERGRQSHRQLQRNGLYVGTTSRLRSTSAASGRPLKRPAAKGCTGAGPAGRTAVLSTALENLRLFADQMAARQVLQQLQHLRASALTATLASPYYAVLLMDGDQLGQHMGDKVKLKNPSAPLNQFTRSGGRHHCASTTVFGLRRWRRCAGPAAAR